MKPLVSIIMGIYNCAETLPESIDSILAQSFSDWELILCDDGSADSTYAVAQRYAEKYPERIRLLKNEKNLGLNLTLNRCLREARGAFIARQDGDDLSLPHRLQTEVDFLEAHPEYAFVSSAMIHFDETGDWGRDRVIEAPEKKDFVAKNPFFHAPCMVRREAYELAGGYDTGTLFLRKEDYHLWCKMYAKGLRGYNLSEPLYKMRDDMNAISRRTLWYRIVGVAAEFRCYQILKLPLRYYLMIPRSLMIGLLPTPLYQKLHKKKHEKIDAGEQP